MKTRCKFRCESVEKFDGFERVKFVAKYSNTPEDNTYSKYTPNGGLTFDVSNEAVFGFFVPGKAYFLDITEVPPAVGTMA